MTVLLAGLLTGGVIAAGATPALARPAPGPAKARPTLAARLAPPVVTTGEPSALVGRLSPAQAGRPVTVEALTDGTWTPVASGTGTTGTSTAGTVDAAGRAVLPVDTASAGSRTLRLVAPAWNDAPQVVSPALTLKVYTDEACRPTVPLVDAQATTAARCLAARLDRWRRAGLMGVGQELNMSTSTYTAPLEALGGRRVSVVGFDLWELGKTRTYEFPFFDQALGDLIATAQSGAVLTASWHAPNPHTGLGYDDRSWHRFGRLLDAGSPEAQRFWAGYDDQLAVFAALQAAGVAVVFRPFHEVNGDWFWWGRPSAGAFKRVWREMQDRAWAAGVHNVVWAYSFAASTRKGIAAPEKLVPPRVDLAGIDSYHPSTKGHRGRRAPSMSGYAAVATKVRRMAFTEVGPAADPRGSWQPSVITATARAQGRKPVWAMLWVDDATGRKQISSLSGGPAWLDSCPFGYCDLG